MWQARLGHSACTVGDDIIVVTGTKMGEYGATCEFFDINKTFWVELPKLNQPRYYHSSCSFNGKFIYVFGGAVQSG